ncbi:MULTISPECIES: hypothetical protein [unclassified Oceanispirochaeta]|uniref:hypothetical protein n=1 Tax=unclassified Oceanispirochaeta TaxID=2635722 RepID=UPI000E0924D2|nr:MULTISPECIES: hypothetical protein [unclassified Oceanispirochaeta]MBF9014365.1 hypothetical protein [Oceanispirochaeta sp. M2]NPD71251.1 hypothetical protein [Oceanispirochaeta sp. M1]RDG33636.1 hypothetical protein DV872_03970 [Oceanispirochaeta sp. M1]
MEGLAVILGLGIFFSPLIAVLFLRKRIRSIEELNADLQKRVSNLESGLNSASEDTGELFKSDIAPVHMNTGISDVTETFDETSAVQEVKPLRKTRERKKEKKVYPILQRLEKQFLENWSGIVGSVIMVLGAGFLSIYAALKFDEFVRFLLLLLLAALPGVLYYLLKDREKWQRQALWMRSISAAIFLFACLGSAGIPGLQWIHNPIQSLGLLILGIAVNLALSSLGRKEEFASFHCLLSLLALSVLPPGFVSLLMAVVITLYALIHCYKNRWELHLLLVLSGFFAYHMYWMYSLWGPQFDALRLQGAAALSLIFLVSTFVHYRKSYASPRFQVFPFLTHLINWLYFSVGMYLYIGDKPERSIVLFAGSLLALSLSHRAARKAIPWLRSSSVVMGQILLCAGLVSLKGWDVPSIMISGFLYVELLLFLQIIIRQKRRELYRFALWSYLLAAGILLFLCLKTEGLNSLIYVTALAVTALLHHRMLWKREDRIWLSEDFPWRLKREFSITGFLAGLAGSAALILLPPDWGTYQYLYAAGLSIIILTAYRQSESRGLGTGVLTYLVLFSLMAADTLLSAESLGVQELAVILSLVLSIGLSFFWEEKVSRLISICALIMAVLTLMITTFLLFNPVSPLLPGFFWLGGVLLLIRLPGLPQRFRSMAILFLLSFLIRHFMVHINYSENWGFWKLRYFSDLALLLVFFLWRRPAEEKLHPLFKGILEYSLDLGLLITAVLIAIEVDGPWVPFALSGVTLSILLYRLAGKTAPRMPLYSLLYYMLSLTGVSLSLLNRPEVSRLAAVLSLLTLLGALLLFFRKEDFRSTALPSLEKYKHGLLLYSLALVTAFFVYESFDSSYLTLLLALECFFIFSASLFLGESHFRILSQGGLLLCVIRLIFIDLSESTVLLKGLVFLGVGLMMLGTNSLYNRYKDRFKVKELEE